MQKAKIESGKQLQVNIPVPDSDSEPIKSPVSSPRLTRQTTAALAMAELDINILFKFIKSYNGDRETLNSFIVNCNNAYEYASENQKPILFKYILSQLSGKAEVACSIKEFGSWEQLKEFLKTQFSQRKHYSHLLTELQESRQGAQETVSQYALRVETNLSQLLTEISLSTTKAKELPGRTAAMEDLALHHFLMGLYPRISNIVRCKSPKNLNEAMNLAISEERIQQTLYKRPQNDQRPNNSGSNDNSARFRPSKSFNNLASNLSRGHKTPWQPQASQNQFCRYCKIPGHDISQCKKREYNNNRFKIQQHPSPRVNFVDSHMFLPQDEADASQDVNDSSPDPLNE